MTCHDVVNLIQRGMAPWLESNMVDPISPQRVPKSWQTGKERKFVGVRSLHYFNFHSLPVYHSSVPSVMK